MDLDTLSDERIRALASAWLPNGMPNPYQVLDPAAAERYLANRKAAEPDAAPDLTTRLAAWLEAEGFASADSAPDLAERIITAAGEGKASGWLRDENGSQALRDTAIGVAALASLGDAGLAMENFRHGHGRRPGHIRMGEVVND